MMPILIGSAAWAGSVATPAAKPRTSARATSIMGPLPFSGLFRQAADPRRILAICRLGGQPFRHPPIGGQADPSESCRQTDAAETQLHLGSSPIRLFNHR